MKNEETESGGLKTNFTSDENSFMQLIHTQNLWAHRAVISTRRTFYIVIYDDAPKLTVWSPPH